VPAFSRLNVFRSPGKLIIETARQTPLSTNVIRVLIFWYAFEILDSLFPVDYVGEWPMAVRRSWIPPSVIVPAFLLNIVWGYFVYVPANTRLEIGPMKWTATQGRMQAGGLWLSTFHSVTGRTSDLLGAKVCTMSLDL
jgi:hypothetical protein